MTPARRAIYAYGRKFWADEYRMNAKIFNFPNPVVTFLQGFTMGGGVGIGCHGSHRIVGESSQIAMPECGIGLVPDVGGSLLLSRAPGRLGEYLGTTGTRMGPGDAILAGFADYYVPEADWPELIAALGSLGRSGRGRPRRPPCPGRQTGRDCSREIDATFGGETAGDILRALRADGSDFADRRDQGADRGKCPLSMACTVEMIHRVRGADRIERALELEYRFICARCRTAVISSKASALRSSTRTAQPRWRHGGIEERYRRSRSARC